MTPKISSPMPADSPPYSEGVPSLIDALPVHDPSGRLRLFPRSRQEEEIPSADAAVLTTAYPPDGAGKSLANQPTIPGYQLLDELGRGGMGVVYKAWDTIEKREVAIKVIRKEDDDDPDAERRFQREAQAAYRLMHPNIVS